MPITLMRYMILKAIETLYQKIQISVTSAQCLISLLCGYSSIV